MDIFVDEICAMIAYYNKLKLIYTTELEGLPEGYLSCIKRGENDNYFRVYRRNGKRIRKGITRNEAVVCQLARKEYLSRVIGEIERNTEVLERAVAEIKPVQPNKVIEDITTKIAKLPQEFFLRADKSLFQRVLEANKTIRHLSVMDEKMLEEKRSRHRSWAAEEYNRAKQTEETHQHITSRGLRVRSKSEALICERLYDLDIPFRYEETIRVGRYDLAPDFTFEDANNIPFYYEHAGMMAKQSYRERHSWKMREFERVGIVQWDNLIVTYDMHGSINVAIIDAVIRYDIMQRL